MLQLYSISLQVYIYSGEYNISTIEQFQKANGLKISKLNLLEDLDFMNTTYQKITIPQYFEGNNHTISNINYQSNQNSVNLFEFLQQGNQECHEVFIQNLHLKNITLTSNYQANSYKTQFYAGFFFRSSNHPTRFTNITIINSTMNLNGNAGFDSVGGLIGLNWGYQAIVNQVAVQFTIVQRKNSLLGSQDLSVYNNYYAGLIGYNNGPIDIINTDVQLNWNCNSTFDHNLVAGLTGYQKSTLTTDVVTISLTVNSYQATGSEYSGVIADANNKSMYINNIDVKMRGNNYRSVHAGICGRRWSNVSIDTLQLDVYMWNNSIDGSINTINNIIPTRDDQDKIAQCINCCYTEYGFDATLNLQHCHNHINTYLDKNSSISQGQKDCVPQKINILCDVNALCQLRQFGMSKLLTCECFENYYKNVNQQCQGTIEEVEQHFSEIDDSIMQQGIDPITVSVAAIVACLCLASLVWMIWICINKTKFDGKEKPKKQKQPKKLPKKVNNSSQEMDSNNGSITDMENNLDWKPRQKRLDVKNKYYDNNAQLSNKYVSKLKPVQM